MSEEEEGTQTGIEVGDTDNQTSVGNSKYVIDRMNEEEVNFTVQSTRCTDNIQKAASL